MNILIIAPHMDDEVLGCGGIIAKHVEYNNKIWVVFIAHRIYQHKFNKERNKVEKSHALKAKSILSYHEAIFLDLNDERLDYCLQDIIIPLEKIIADIKPEIAYIPFRGDNNQDHRAVFNAARVVFRPSITPFLREIHMYEVPSSTEQSPPLWENAFLPNYYVDISKHIELKLKSIRCYETEKRDYPHPRSEEALVILAQKRGIEIGFHYAESFMMLRGKWY